MSNSQLAASIDRFLRDWRFHNWMDLNPNHQPFSASSHIGIINLLRVSVPACDGVRSARIAEAIRQAGYEVIEDVEGCYIERKFSPESQSDDGLHSGAPTMAAQAISNG